LLSLSIGVLPFELPKLTADLTSGSCTVGPPEGFLGVWQTIALQLSPSLTQLPGGKIRLGIQRMLARMPRQG